MSNATETPFKAYNFSASGVLISAIDVATMDEARTIAHNWNRRHRAKDAQKDQVATICNNRIQAHATRITAI